MDPNVDLLIHVLYFLLNLSKAVGFFFIWAVHLGGPMYTCRRPKVSNNMSMSNIGHGCGMISQVLYRLTILKHIYCANRQF
jgi:hypothetical protein